MAIVFNPFTGGFVVVPNPTFPGTIVIASGKTFTVNNTLTLAGTDSTTMTFPTTSATVARTDAAQTFSLAQTFAPGVGASAIIVTGATQTTSFPVLDLSQTWNAAQVFTGLAFNVTKTTASNGSNWINLSYGGVTELQFRPTGTNASGATQIIGTLAAAFLGIGGVSGLDIQVNGTAKVRFVSTEMEMGAYGVGWGTGPGFSNTVNLIYGGAAGIVDVRAGSQAQYVRIQNTFTTLATAGEWWKLDWQTTANQFRMGAVAGSSSGTNRAASWDYGDKLASATAAITVPATSGNIVFGGGVQLSNAAVTGLVAGAVAALTTATIVLFDSTGQAYRVPCVI